MFSTYSSPQPPTTPKLTVLEAWHTHGISTKRVSLICVDVYIEATWQPRRWVELEPLTWPPGESRARIRELAEMRKKANLDYAYNDKPFSSTYGY